MSSPNWMEQMRLAAIVKKKAFRLFKEAISSGRIVKALNCSGCRGEFKKYGLYPFHQDYSKPYDVLWVCQPCFKNLIIAQRRGRLTEELE